MVGFGTANISIYHTGSSMDATWDEIDVFPGRVHGFGPADVLKNFKLHSYGNIFATGECPQRTPRLLCEPFDLLTAPCAQVCPPVATSYDVNHEFNGFLLGCCSGVWFRAGRAP